MRRLIQMLNGETNNIKLSDGRELTLVTCRETEDDSKTGFYLKTPMENGEFNVTKISNSMGYRLISTF